MKRKAKEESVLLLLKTFGEFGPKYTKWIDKMVRESGVSSARHNLLCILRKEGSLKMSELGRLLTVSPTNITLLVDGLEKDGYVERQSDETDRRATRIKLTERAEKEVNFDSDVIFKPAIHLFSSVFEEKEIQELVHYLNQIMEKLPN
ncbi:MarR family transcriptional regulator [Leptospira yanagawae]|uniref:MarR family transcriptional regulator n=1 Tax=Leptospira yanagawae TaxID=293069 RepID=A0ABY2M5A3_9LEPT|nr:MarR family transcriptional regulator [Leptospira yanagawae]